MSGLDEKLRAVGAMWGGADYERIAETLASVHDRLVDRLDFGAGETWLDVATGTGAVALRLAASGLDVTAVDLSEQLLDQARAKAEADGLDVRWALADAQALPFEDASFDGVVSSFGVIFAPDRVAVARELARVCRPRGRLGLATWVPDAELGRVWAPFTDRPPSADIDFWGDEDNVRELLATDFELDVVREDWSFEAESAEAAWEFSSQAAPPVKALADSLSPERREDFRQAFLAFYERYATPDGIRGHRPFLLVLGHRR